MTKSEEFSKNYTQLKACEKAYKWIFIVNFVMTGMILVMFIFSFIGSVTGYYRAIIPVLLCGLVLPVAHAGSSLYSCYRHHNMYAIVAFVCLAIALFMPTETLIDGLIYIYIVISIPIAIITLIVNKKYLWLEEQPGYPDFNMLLESERERSRKFDEENPFEKRYKEIVRNRAEAMDEIAAADDNIAQKTINDSNYMDEI